jgi:hypothetical protein
MVIYSDKSIEECKKLLSEHIVAYKRNPSYRTPSLLLKDEIIGNVNGEVFWLQKTKPRLFNGFTRVFKGNLVCENGKTKIAGKFVFPAIYKIIALLIMLAVTIRSFADVIENYAEVGIVGSVTGELGLLAVVYCIVVGFMGLNILLYKDEEKSVIAFLNDVMR